MLVQKIFFDYAYVSPENFSDLSPSPRRQHFPEKFARLGQNPRKCWSNHDDTPPMLMASRRPCMSSLESSIYSNIQFQPRLKYSNIQFQLAY
jgi:hypothetical protein